MFAMRKKRNWITAADFGSALEKLRRRADEVGEASPNNMFG